MEDSITAQAVDSATVQVADSITVQLVDGATPQAVGSVTGPVLDSARAPAVASDMAPVADKVTVPAAASVTARVVASMGDPRKEHADSHRAPDRIAAVGDSPDRGRIEGGAGRAALFRAARRILAS